MTLACGAKIRPSRKAYAFVIYRITSDPTLHERYAHLCDAPCGSLATSVRPPPPPSCEFESTAIGAHTLQIVPLADT